MAFERRNFYRAIPAMIQNLGCHDLVPVTAPFSHLLITTSQVYWRPYTNRTLYDFIIIATIILHHS